MRRLQASKFRDKLAYLFAFGSVYDGVEDPEPPCAAAFSIISIPEMAQDSGMVHLLEEFAARAIRTVACGTGRLEEAYQFQGYREGLNDSLPMEFMGPRRPNAKKPWLSFSRTTLIFKFWKGGRSVRLGTRTRSGGQVWRLVKLPYLPDDWYNRPMTQKSKSAARRWCQLYFPDDFAAKYPALFKGDGTWIISVRRHTHSESIEFFVRRGNVQVSLKELAQLVPRPRNQQDMPSLYDRYVESFMNLMGEPSQWNTDAKVEAMAKRAMKRAAGGTFAPWDTSPEAISVRELESAGGQPPALIRVPVGLFGESGARALHAGIRKLFNEGTNRRTRKARHTIRITLPSIPKSWYAKDAGVGQAMVTLGFSQDVCHSYPTILRAGINLVIKVQPGNIYGTLKTIVSFEGTAIDLQSIVDAQASTNTTISTTFRHWQQTILDRLGSPDHWWEPEQRRQLFVQLDRRCAGIGLRADLPGFVVQQMKDHAAREDVGIGQTMTAPAGVYGTNSNRRWTCLAGLFGEAGRSYILIEKDRKVSLQLPKLPQSWDSPQYMRPGTIGLNTRPLPEWVVLGNAVSIRLANQDGQLAAFLDHGAGWTELGAEIEASGGPNDSMRFARWMDKLAELLGPNEDWATSELRAAKWERMERRVNGETFAIDDPSAEAQELRQYLAKNQVCIYPVTLLLG